MKKLGFAALATAASLGFYDHLNKADFFVPRAKIDSNATVCIVGGGSIGVSTALELHRRGYKVKLVERLHQPAAATSRGNAGVVSYTSTLLLDPRKLFGFAGVINFSSALDPWFWVWSTRWFFAWYNFKARTEISRIYNEFCADCLVNPKEDISAFKKAAMFVEKPAIDVYMDEKYANKAGKLDDLESVKEIEPIIKCVHAPISGAAVRTGGKGDCHHYMRSVTEHLLDEGVEIFFGTEFLGTKTRSDGSISSIIVAPAKRRTLPKGSLIAYGETYDSPKNIPSTIEADAFVFCVGPFANKELRLPGLILPLKGYSLTVDYDALEERAEHPVVFQPSKLYMTPCVDGIRFTSFVELDGSGEARPERFQELKQMIRDVLPVSEEYLEKALFWHGHRPVTPDDIPIISKGYEPNCFYNFGNSTRGWKQSAGSAKLVANLIDGSSSPVDMSYFDVRRFWFWRPKSFEIGSSYWNYLQDEH